jgi:hypothetical protein
VGQTKNYIELNGKRYDATTGALITSVAPPKPAAAKPVAKAAKTAAKSATGKAIDSFRHPATKPAAKPAAPKTAVKAAAPAPAKPAAKPVMDVRRAPASHIARRKQQHSQTLMRKSVKRPAPGLKRVAKTQTRTDILAKVPKQQVAPKVSIRRVDEKRLRRATGVSKSQLISHFNAPAVKPAPKPVAKPVMAPATTKPVHKPLKPAIVTTHARDIRPVYAASAAPVAPRQASMDIFEQALARANSHKQTVIDPKKLAKTKKKKSNRRARRIISGAAAAMAVLVIGGFIALQNTANLKMHLASSRAGVHATLPAHKPSGFAAVKFSYGNGFVTVDYRNTGNGQDYQVTQTASNWNSDALYNEYVAATAGKNYDTVQAGGRTIYTYGNHNATWVDGGIWYNITSDGALSGQELIDVAKSM